MFSFSHGRKYSTSPKETTQKWAIVARYNFLCDPKTGKLPDGLSETREYEFEMSLRQIQRIMQQYNTSRDSGEVFPDLKRKDDLLKGPPSQLTEELMRYSGV